MSRLSKQLIYGFLFFLFWAVVSAIVYFVYVRPGPGCFNGRQDDGEEGVDCGGVCAAVCLPQDMRPLEAVGEPRIFRSSPTVVGILVKIQNPNLEFAAKSFNYRIDVYDTSDTILASRSGSSFIYAGEIKYLADFISVPNSQDAFRAVITVESREWLPVARYSLPRIAIQDKRTEVRNEAIIVSGRILNQDVADFPRVEVVAILYNNFGLPVGVVRTEVENVWVGEPREFAASHPLSISIDPARTEYFVYARRP